MERIVIEPGQEIIIDGKIVSWGYIDPQNKTGLLLNFKDPEENRLLLQATIATDANWKAFKFDEVKDGDIVRNRGRKDLNYIINGNWGGRATAVRVADITNEIEWEVFILKPAE